MAALRLRPSILAINPGLAPSPVASAAATSARSGASWESVVEDALRALVAARVVAHYQKHDARKIERKSQVVGRVPGACDFSGVLVAGAVGFCIECKSGVAVYATRAHAVHARRPRAPAFTDEQREQLAAYERVGAPALVAARVGGLGVLIPWRDVASAEVIDASIIAGRAAVDVASLRRLLTPRPGLSRGA